MNPNWRWERSAGILKLWDALDSDFFNVFTSVIEDYNMKC